MSATYQTDLRFSQNFIKDPQLVLSLIEKSSISLEDVVYEIGPGTGVITSALVNCCKKVIAIEKDSDLSAMLQRKLCHLPNLTIRTGNFLEYKLPRKPYKVFSNIPFCITSAIMTKLSTTQNPPEDSFLIMQKEAAEMFSGIPHETLRSILLKPSNRQSASRADAKLKRSSIFGTQSDFGYCGK